MHYLDELAERLVLSYEDAENLHDWVAFADRVAKRKALVKALRKTLESEVIQRRLRYQSLRIAPVPGESDEILLTADWM